MAVTKILSVDDEAPLEALMRQYFRRKIRSGEYEFFFARNGLEALAILYNNPDIEIILSDINMPEMDGLTLLTKVNEMRNPALRVIMVSAYGDMQNIRQAMNNGAFDFATKPIDMDDLSLTIEKAIDQIRFHDMMDIYASMEAASDIGGDFYDFFRLDGDHIALVIADVCGKGIPAALFMAVSRTIIRSKGTQCDHAGECLTESNRLLSAYSVDCMFITVFYAIYNTKTGLVTYSNAGHNPPLLLRSNGRVEVLPKPKNTIVGAFDNISYKEDTFQLEHGDTLVLFTDGVTEAMNPHNEEFGSKRLNDVLGGLASCSSQQIVETVKSSVREFADGAEQSDDITMLVLKRR